MLLSRRDFGDDDDSSSWLAGKENARRSRWNGSVVGVTMTGTMGARGGREAVSLRGFLGS
jgi:hypothetical protein